MSQLEFSTAAVTF